MHGVHRLRQLHGVRVLGLRPHRWWSGAFLLLLTVLNFCRRQPSAELSFDVVMLSINPWAGSLSVVACTLTAVLGEWRAAVVLVTPAA